MISLSEKMSRVLVSSAEVASDFFPPHMLDRCGSEIEMLMATALWSRGHWTSRAAIAPEQTIHELKKFVQGQYQDFGFMPFAIGQQVQIAKYRLDFLLVGHGFETGSFHMLAVECDGHDFHEKTKEQAARDKSRDRAIAAQGITTMRFAGSEVWKDAGACADEIFDFFQKKWEYEVDIAVRKHFANPSEQQQPGAPA